MIKLHVTGMTCGHCESAVEKALMQVPGVDKVVKVSRESEEALVEGNADSDALVNAVASEGYTAKVA